MPDFLPAALSPYDIRVALQEGFRTFLLKAHRDCNLHCTYCYVYNMADRSWKTKPACMSAEMIAIIADRIREHVVAHAIPEIDVLFHGGEPLLGGVEYLASIKHAIEAQMPSAARANFGMQTNGLLLSDAVLDALVREGINFGISLDGPPKVNDRVRVFRSGKGSHDEVLRAAERVLRHPARDLFAGFLAVIDVESDPETVLAYFDGIGARRLDFLLPHGHWDALPPGMTAPNDGRYSRWLVRAFDSWFDRYSHVRVRYFADAVKLFLGGTNSVESLGLGLKSIVVVESDGAIEGLDTLKAVQHGATDIGMNVRSHSFEDALSHPAMYSRFLGSAALCQQCRDCSFVNVCGGGYLPHRYMAMNGYINPSVYCDDLYSLWKHVSHRLQAEVRALA